MVSSDEKFWRRIHRMEETHDFIKCPNKCGLQDAGFCGSKSLYDNRYPITLLGKDSDFSITLYGKTYIFLLMLLTYPECARTMLHF